MTGLDIGAAVRRQAREADSLLLEIDGSPVAMVGLSRPGAFLSEYRNVWGVFTDGIYRHPLASLRAARNWSDRLQGGLVLNGWVMAKNTAAVRALEWLGFSMGEARDFGGERFLEFERLT